MQKEKNHEKKIGSLDSCEINSKFATHMKLVIQKKKKREWNEIMFERKKWIRISKNW